MICSFPQSAKVHLMPCRSQARSDIHWDISGHPTAIPQERTETPWDASTFPSDEIVAPLEDTNELVIGDVVKIFQIYKAQPDWAAFFMKQLIPALRSKSTKEIRNIYGRCEKN